MSEYEDADFEDVEDDLIEIDEDDRFNAGFTNSLDYYNAKIKVFNTDDQEDLEAEVNCWLEKEDEDGNVIRRSIQNAIINKNTLVIFYYEENTEEDNESEEEKEYKKIKEDLK